ncbi:1-deoxy-D-xylulose-5-phosphate reductoisomerase [Paraglaciecola aquimarina]|uniref:1-deoxy-D-xylulose 5-phosphate reductoisomerase n=1 Tax=Paraglaciecola algarum TaxID=3050085 RepID=A0ABS9DEF8_9ALTE|nr:1-deoxy-D-xylulose-5-phosphate reductoisomerase [Paraglaciecola sp. G1-23]MCF2950154.1 1-deoxy-D-xylulose-5-phosphate reductoisomerase [Paraglaciecola sp. G1-23]
MPAILESQNKVQKISILGATGSIGQSTIDVVSRHSGQFKVFALTANRNLELLLAQAKACQPEYVVVADETCYKQAKQLFSQANLHCEVLVGQEGLIQVASATDVDIVMAAIVGAAGLLPTLAAAKSGKKVLLANKESLVMSGDLFIQAANDNNAQLLPIDSEHNAIFQCLPVDYKYGDLASSGISKILLTGSGGPFLNTPLTDLSSVTPEQACAHPNWDMGKKISVDSATMMNKGLEFIEARYLFGLKAQDIEVVLHPQSIIHSMVQYVDGSVIAQMGNPDMRTPIAHALAYPERIESGVKPLDFSTLANFSFSQPESARFPNLDLAIQASKAGQYATTVLNAANEISVQAFLQGQIGFTQIAQVNQECLQQTSSHVLDSIDAVIASDQAARACTQNIIKGFNFQSIKDAS